MEKVLNDKNLNHIYEYLIKNNMFDLFIKAIVEENETYKKMIKYAKTRKNTLNKAS